MSYKLQKHFLNDVTTWRAHVPALINIVIIKSLFLHQCRLHSNGNGFKIVQKSFIQSSSNLQEANHLGFSCQHKTLSLPHERSGFYLAKKCHATCHTSIMHIQKPRKRLLLQACISFQI